MVEEKSSSVKTSEDKEAKKEETGREKEIKEETPKEKKEKSKKEKGETEEKQEEQIEIPKHLKKLVEEIESLKVLDLAKLVKILEKKFGISAGMTASVAAATASSVAGAPAAVEEKTSFNVLLMAVGDKKIEVIKTVRDLTQRGLKESKDLVDKVAEGPQIIKENVKKEEAEEMKKKLEVAGARVELK